MPYANNNGVKTYYEVEGEGPPLVLAHAAGSSSNDFRKNGFADVLNSDYQLVMFDARGFGLSDKPHNSADYDMRLRREDVLAVLDDTGATQAHFLGYSMGSMLGVELMTKESGRFSSFILGGFSPYGRSEAQYKQTLQVIEDLRLLMVDPEAYFQRIENNLGRSLTSEQRNERLSLDPEAFIAVIESQLDLPPLTNDDLSRISVPCLFFCGSLDPYHDGAKEAASIIPQGEFVSIPDLNHGQAWTRSDLIVPYIRDFLSRVPKT